MGERKEEADIMIRTAIAGMGIRGSLFAQGLTQNPTAELVGVCDADQEALKEASEAWGVPGYQDFEELLEAQQVDAAIICTPDFAHRAPVLAAARHGVHVMVEKPLATTEAEAREMMEAVRQAGVICQVAFENRWNPPFTTIKQAVEQGELGEVSLINAKLNDTLYVPTTMLGWAEKSTVGWFLLPHVVDLAIWLSGKRPSKVYAVANKRVLPALGIDTYDTICTTLSFEGEMQAMFETTWVLPASAPAVFDFKFEIVGDKGAMYVDAQDQMVHQATARFSYPGTLVADIHGRTRGFPLYMLDSFIDSVEEERDPLATIEEGYQVTRVIDAVHRSIETGHPVTV
jgi:predicted dehydrogenase